MVRRESCRDRGRNRHGRYPERTPVAPAGGQSLECLEPRMRYLWRAVKAAPLLLAQDVMVVRSDTRNRDTLGLFTSVLGKKPETAFFGTPLDALTEGRLVGHRSDNAAGAKLIELIRNEHEGQGEPASAPASGGNRRSTEA